jgi:hypothetical protein
MKSSKSLLRPLAVAALLTATVSAACSADEDSTQVRPTPTVDTLLFDQKDAFKTVSPVTDPENFETHLRQQPTVALFKSMVVPGLGQWGNHAYVKALLFAGLDAWFIGSAIHYGQQASDFHRRWDASSDIPTRNEYYSLYEDRRESRNAFTWYAVITAFVSMFDAYVDAHLSGFPAKAKEKGVAVQVVPVQRGTAVVLTYRF